MIEIEDEIMDLLKSHRKRQITKRSLMITITETLFSVERTGIPISKKYHYQDGQAARVYQNSKECYE